MMANPKTPPAQATDLQTLEWAAMIFQEGVYDQAGRVLVRPSVRKAKQLLEAAVAQGSSTAANNLGVLLDVVGGPPQDSARALRLYKQNLPGSATNIAHWYRLRGRLRDAVRWWRWASERGDTSAFLDLGYCQLFGVGTRVEPTAGVAALRQASRGRNTTEWEREEALYLLALATWEGLGTQRSRARAVKLLERASVDDDYPEAQDFLLAIEEGHAVGPCRCRRERVGHPGNAPCGVHGLRGRARDSNV